MEDQNRFDLNRAIFAWKEELALQPGIRPEDLRELESHLVEGICAEQRKGLNERDAFDAAARKIGPIHLIAAEFEKAHPLRTWRSRASLMVLSGLMIWVWTQVSSTLLAAMNLFPALGQSWSISLALLLNVLLPLVLILLVANGRAKGWLRGLADLFGNRWLAFGTVVGFALLTYFAGAWVTWHHPKPELIFGPGGRENLSVTRIFWAHLGHFPFWPGPIVALAIWLVPDAYRGLHAAATATQVQSSRELLLWVATGWLALECFGWLSGAFWVLWSSFAYSVFATSELGFRIMRSGGQVLSAVCLCILVVLAAKGRFANLSRSICPRLIKPQRLMAFGLPLILLCYGTRHAAIFGFRLGHMQPGAGILLAVTEMFWPAFMVGIIAWLAPLLIAKPDPADELDELS